MSRPAQQQSISAATSAGAGTDFRVSNRVSLVLYVEAAGLDASNDTLEVRLEASQTGDNWSPIYDESGTQVAAVTASEFADPDGTGTFATFLYVHGVGARFIRPNVTSYTDDAGSDLEVSVWVGAADNSGQYDYRTTGT